MFSKRIFRKIVYFATNSHHPTILFPFIFPLQKNAPFWMLTQEGALSLQLLYALSFSKASLNLSKPYMAAYPTKNPNTTAPIV